MVSMGRFKTMAGSVPEKIANDADLRNARRVEGTATKAASVARFKATVYGAVTAVSGGFGVWGLTFQPVGSHSNAGQVAGLAVALASGAMAMESLDKRDKFKAAAEVLRDRINIYHKRRYDGKA